jgi:hypothetical protein
MIDWICKFIYYARIVIHSQTLDDPIVSLESSIRDIFRASWAYIFWIFGMSRKNGRAKLKEPQSRLPLQSVCLYTTVAVTTALAAARKEERAAFSLSRLDIFRTNRLVGASSVGWSLVVGRRRFGIPYTLSLVATTLLLQAKGIEFSKDRESQSPPVGPLLSNI